MRFVASVLAILLLLVSQAWGASPELYEALGSPAGRFILGELGAGRTFTERWATAAAFSEGVDPTEEILERVRVRFLTERPGEELAFRETPSGSAAFLSAGQRTRLGSLLEEETRSFFGFKDSLSEKNYAFQRESFLAGSQVGPKEQWLKSSHFFPEGNQELLHSVRADAIARVKAGERATVVFDLDETGIDNRFGTAAMLLGKGGWVNRPESAAFPRARQALLALKLSQIRIMADDIFVAAGIADEKEAMKSVDDFLYKRIHTAAKAEMYGAPYPGFVEYVRSLHEAGVRIVYLTGRPAGAQTTGTADMLKLFGLPLDDNALLFLREERIPTPKFKTGVIKRMMSEDSARIVAIFENEPENLIEMDGCRSGAKLVFVDTDFSRVPAQPASGWYRLRHW